MSTYAALAHLFNPVSTASPNPYTFTGTLPGAAPVTDATFTAVPPTLFLNYLIAAAVYLWRDLGNRRSATKPMPIYDYIIVGGGASGAVLASRLTEDPATNVLLLEAGGSGSQISDIPLIWSEWLNTNLSRRYTSEPQKKICGLRAQSRCELAVGRALGGSSIHNAMLYVRGNRLDFDEWETLGARNWSYANVLPYFLRSEDNLELGPDEYHARGGPMGVTFEMYEPFLDVTTRWLSAARELGLPLGDYNAKRQAVFSPLQNTIRRGVRQSTDKSFIQPFEGKRKNLDIILLAQVTRVLFDGTSAVGVEYVRNDVVSRVYASREVVLSAGALATPQILMLSGIGPKEQLSKLDIPSIANLPVGKSLQDHVTVLISFSTNATFPDNSEINEDNYKLWNATGKGVMGSPNNLAVGFVHTKFSTQRDDVQVQLTISVNPVTKTGSPKVWQRLDVLIETSKVKSRGELTLRTINPLDDPIVDPNYLQDAADGDNLVEGVKLALKLSLTTPFQAIDMMPLAVDIRECATARPWTETYIRCYVRYLGNQGFHYVGTSRMGSGVGDPLAVVDERLRVIGLRRLRVADASIMPTLIRGNTYATSVMIGEKAADLIRDDNNSNTINNLVPKMIKNTKFDGGSNYRWLG